MKKSLLALAVLGAYAGVASAQSSVTIFGIVDLSINQIKNGTLRTTSMQSNQLNSNRLGFRGFEDLGGGLGAGFHIEGGMNNANGTGSTAGAFDWRRKSTVSLISQAAGELRLGRDYTPTFLNLGAFDVYGANGIGQDANLISAVSAPADTGFGGATGVRADNSIGYFLPGNLGGFYGSAMYALGQGNDNNKYWGLRGGFASGPFDVSLAYGETELGASAVIPASDKLKVMNVGGSWNFGVAKIYGLWNKTEVGNFSEDFLELSVGVPLGQGELKAGYAQVKDDGTQGGVSLANSDAWQWALQYIYNLSKRTALYGGIAQLDNDPCSARSVLNGTIGSTPTGTRQVANCTANLSGKKSEGFNIGVRHSF
jgi:predicted porin